MRVVRPRYLPLCLVPVVIACSSAPSEDSALGLGRSALGGIEGSMEVALDAPWRIEPVVEIDGAVRYGQIPIQISIHDANQAASDSTYGTARNAAVTPRLGNFCDLVIEQRHGAVVVGTRKSFSELIEVEATIGSWAPGGAPPPHQVCKPALGHACEGLRDIGPTSEWHAGAWYQPLGPMTPGRDIPLALKARLTRDPATSCSSSNEADFLTITNYVKVHLGEAPLPRFDAGWLYGDLHYHAQGTDNEGEAGYHNRGVIRAIGAMGVDFVLASDHASASEQIVDVDVERYLAVFAFDPTGGVLRDMNGTRFRHLHRELWRSGGVNAEALLGPGGAPQGYASHGVVPRVLLGGEVDVIGEIGKSWDGEGYTFGNGLRFDLDRLCGGWDLGDLSTTSCDPKKLRHDVGDAILFRDVQGIHDYGYSRAHLVYLPKSSKDEGAFVASHSGKYGGGGRRLAKSFDGLEGVLPEIERKGYAFLAHHVPGGSCPGRDHGGYQPNGAALMADLDGGEGPDAAPYTDTMLAHAFESPAVLGLEFWNEDTRLCTSIGQGDAREIGFGEPGLLQFENFARPGYVSGQFELAPWYEKSNQSFQYTTGAVEWTLHHGAASWDKLLREGIDPVRTGTLTWLPSGDPRRVFMGGGSDAHGDFNYRREGYMRGTTKITDTAIAKVRNLVYAGAPAAPNPTHAVFDPSATTTTVKATTSTTGTASGTTTSTTTSTSTSSKTVDPSTSTVDPGSLVLNPGAPEIPVPHTQEQIVDAFADGNFSVTDGPAIRLVVDKNRNGIVDAGDTPMGGIVELNGEETLPVLVEWLSTPEFGAVNEIQLYVGVQNGKDANRSARTYAVAGHGPRAWGVASSEVVSSYSSNGRTYSQMKDGYWADPTGMLRVYPTAALSGSRRIDLPIAAFQAADGRAPDRLYVRAFAATQQQDPAACATSDVARRSGACIRRYAFTNPVWAIPAPKPWTGECLPHRPRAMDRDSDGIPDGCDPCPDTSASVCLPRPPIWDVRISK